MLLEFQVENYLSFKDTATLSMLASPRIKKDLQDSVSKIGKYDILTSGAIYGANASGKSNLIKAIRFMKSFILESANEGRVGKDINVSGFRLNSSCDQEPSTFEMTFIVQGFNYGNKLTNVVFRYGFQIDKAHVCSEWLFARFTAQESRLFVRTEDEITIGEKFNEGKQLYKTTGKIRETSLFLSQIFLLKGKNAIITHAIINWFLKLQDISPMSDHNFMDLTADMLKDEEKKKRILQALCHADICIDDITVKKKQLDISEIPEPIISDFKDKTGKVEPDNFYTLTINAIHKKYNDQKEVIGEESFDFQREESQGSQKFFALIGPILDALRHGLVLVIDEIDARLHPSLCEVLIALFNSPKTNTSNAQLIFASHNTLVMNKRLLRRDQIYFTEKNKYGESTLYSLLDYTKVRNDASYDKDYLMGKYGGTPYLGDFESLLTWGE